MDIPGPAVREWDFPRGTGSVLLMTRFAADHGVAAERLLTGTGLAEATLDDPHTQLDAHTELAVTRSLVRHLGDRVPDLGLRLGVRYQPTTFGIFGFACVSSPTLRAVISFALRYWDLSFAFGLPTVEQSDGEIRLELRDGAIPEDVRSMLVERDLAAIFTMMNDLLPRAVALRRMDFRYPEPSYVDAYVEVFGTRPVFGAAANVSAFDDALLDEPLPQANAQTVALCEAQCRDLVSARRARTGIAQEVRTRLVRLDGTDTSMEGVARDLNVSVRTLRRKLSEDGTSYRALLDEVRQALAEELLATGALSVSDVAIRLGFSEASSFIYSFKRWKGMTPSAYARGSHRPVR